MSTLTQLTKRKQEYSALPHRWNGGVDVAAMCQSTVVCLWT